ncbi:MAG: hypothetical protein AABW65_00405 [Nanoarchaeota archaeon]
MCGKNSLQLVKVEVAAELCSASTAQRMNMKHYNLGKYLLCESSEFDSSKNFSSHKNLERHIRAISHCFMRRPLIRQMVEKVHKKMNKRKVIMLCAHGVSYKSKWAYVDGKRRRYIQDWISDNDGKAATLLLKCCNEENYDISSRHSIVIHPRSAVSNIEIIRGWNGHNMRVYAPSHGYVDENYRALHHALTSI